MSKAERILDFVHKIANKQGITYEQAEELAITQEFIKQVNGESECYDLRSNADNLKCNCS